MGKSHTGQDLANTEVSVLDIHVQWPFFFYKTFFMQELRIKEASCQSATAKYVSVCQCYCLYKTLQIKNLLFGAAFFILSYMTYCKSCIEANDSFIYYII